MYNKPLIPPDFNVPERFDGNGYHLRMLSIDDVDKDFEAVMESADRLRGLLDPNSTWPDGLTKKEDMIDLAWHQREFTLRHSFAYTVMSLDETRCLGCIYIFPSKNPKFDALAFYWVRAGQNADAFDQELGILFRAWLADAWPFKAIAFPGRETPWDSVL
jgi:hypothetical protein